MKNILMIFLLAFSCTSSFADNTNPYAKYREKTYTIQEQYLQKISNHQQKIMTDLERKLDQQQWQTSAIAIMVFIMVGVGLLLSYLQFRRDKEGKNDSQITFKIGSGSFEIRSPVIGLIILALSFWFFQTYIQHVYNVNVFNIPPVDMTTFGVNG